MKKRLKLELRLLKSRRAALMSDLAYKEYQYNTSMPCDEGMDDPRVALLIGHGLRRDRDALDASIAEKRLELHDADAQSGQQQA